MPIPVQLAVPSNEETFGGVTYHIKGELVPVLEIELENTPIYFENHVLLWKDPLVDIRLKSLKGMLKRMLAGLPVFITEAHGPGRIAFSRDATGHVFSVHLHPGESLDVREHQFLAATNSIDYSFARVKGLGNMLFSSTGFFIDTFTASQQEGIVWLHGYGNVFEVELKAGEQIDIEPGGWVYKWPTVNMETIFQKVSTGLFASGQLFWNRFTGPGKVGIQSMTYYLPTTTDT